MADLEQSQPKSNALSGHLAQVKRQIDAIESSLRRGHLENPTHVTGPDIGRAIEHEDASKMAENDKKMLRAIENSRSASPLARRTMSLLVSLQALSDVRDPEIERRLALLERALGGRIRSESDHSDFTDWDDHDCSSWITWDDHE